MRRRLNIGLGAALVVALAAATLLVTPPEGAGAQASGNQGLAGWVLAADGSVTPIGGAPDYGDAAGAGSPAVAIEPTHTGLGYYIALASGRVLAFGDAVNHGSIDQFSPDAPVVDMRVTSDSGGYTLLTRDGGIFAVGNAVFHGSAPSVVPPGALEGSAVGLISDGSRGGYGIVFDDGGVFNFGSSRFFGSLPGIGIGRHQLAGLIVGAVMSADGKGYGLVGLDGGVFSFGSYRFLGSLSRSGATFAGMGVIDGGYALVSHDGTISTVKSSGTETAFVAQGLQSQAVDVAVRPVVRVQATTTTTTEATTTTERATTTTTRATTTTTRATTTTRPRQTTTTRATTTTTRPRATTTTTTRPRNTTTTTQGGGGGGGGTGPAGAQFSVLKASNVSNTGRTQGWIQPPVMWPGSGSMRSPINYAGGNAYARVHVKNKPTNIAMAGQFCFWFQYRGFQEYEETCSPEAALRITTPGVYYVEIRPPASWWSQNGPKNRNGFFDWGKRPHVGRLLLKDPVSKSLFAEQSCGSTCWSRGNALDHLPVTVDLELIFVQQGRSFTPPANWTGNPWR